MALFLTTVIVSLTLGAETSSSHCPPWMSFNITSNFCECGSDLHGIVRCNQDTQEVSLQDCYCMTYSEELNQSLVNYCFYTCKYTRHAHHHSINTKNVSDLNDAMCKDFNRTGVMCGECIAGHAPPVYSYSAACVECKDYKYNWIKYIAVAYLPLTLFFVAIVLLKISVNSAPLVVYVTLCQIISSPGFVRWYAQHLKKQTPDSILIAPLAIWNLDFFRGWYEPFCLHPDLSLLQVTCLDYIVGLYPLLLIGVTYCIVRLHDRYVVISKLWKPVFKACFLLRKEWNIRESLVSVFATFIILSYVKTLNVSVDILDFGHAAFDMHGNTADFYYLAINNSLMYFSQEHMPYALCAICMVVIFNVLPLVLLCVYPCFCFQKCLNITECHSHLLHIFMDTFQGCFREKPRDCRYFAGFYVFLRVANLVVLSWLYNLLYTFGISCILFCTVVLLAVCRPYKSQRRNTIDIIFLSYGVAFVNICGCIGIGYYAAPLSESYTDVKHSKILYLLVLVFPLYGVIMALYQVVKCGSKVTKCWQCLKRYNKEEESLLAASMSEVNPLV